MGFFIPGETIANATAFGTAPPTGYYEAKILGPAKAHTKAGTYYLELQFDGFTTKTWIHTAHDDQGNLLPGVNAKRTGGIKALTESLGLDNEWLRANGFNSDWLGGEGYDTCYIGWLSKEDTEGGQYGEVDGFVNKAYFDSAIEKGNVPASKAIRRASAAPARGAGGPPAPAATVAPPSTPATTNGAVPPAPAKVPPPPPMRP